LSGEEKKCSATLTEQTHKEQAINLLQLVYALYALKVLSKLWPYDRPTIRILWVGAGYKNLVIQQTPL
jgi:hypothetical protein